MEEKNTNWWKVGGIIIAALLLFALGFYIGWKREPEVIVKTEIEYVELPPIHDSIPTPVPVYIKKPVDSLDILLALIESGKYNELFPSRDSIVYVTKEDTAAVIRDWATERHYRETLFDADTLGRFAFDAIVQYNRLQDFEYTYSPVQKVETVTVKTIRKFLPYVGAGLDTGGSVAAQGGLFVSQDAGFAVQYRYDIKRKENVLGAMFLYMF